jgi:glycosyltransferase involved in cell wall biosynthesis
MIGVMPTPVVAIAGSGDLADELRTRSREAGVASRIHFLGNVAQDDVAGWFAAADVVAVPSVRDDSGNVDGLPNTVLEALASATPVVATTAGGIASVIDDGKTGLLVPERDAASLAHALESLLKDPARRRAIGAAARAAIEAQFGWDAVARRFEAAYDRALAFTSSGR